MDDGACSHRRSKQPKHHKKNGRSHRHVAVAAWGSGDWEVSKGGQGGRGLDMCRHKRERQHVASLHAEIRLLQVIMRRWTMTKFLKRVATKRFHMWSLAFDYDDAFLDNPTPSMLKGVCSVPCKDCVRVLQYYGVRTVSFFNRSGDLIKRRVAELIDVAMPSFATLRLNWLHDQQVLQETAITTTLFVNSKQTFDAICSGRKKWEWRCLWNECDRKKTSSPNTPKWLRRLHTHDLIYMAYRSPSSRTVLKMPVRVQHISRHRNTTVEHMLAQYDYTSVVPDAATMDDAMRRFVQDCYSHHIDRYGPICTIVRIRIAPLMNTLSRRNDT